MKKLSMTRNNLPPAEGGPSTGGLFVFLDWPQRRKDVFPAPALTEVLKNLTATFNVARLM